MSLFLKDVRWGYLLLSTLLLFCFLLLFGSLTASFKSEAFVFALKKGIIEWKNINNHGNEFVNSSYWAPLDILCVLISQLLSSIFYIKKCKGFEHTNGLAFGIISSILIYQFEALHSLIAFLVSIIVAYKIKNSMQK